MLMSVTPLSIVFEHYDREFRILSTTWIKAYVYFFDYLMILPQIHRFRWSGRMIVNYELGRVVEEDGRGQL